MAIIDSQVHVYGPGTGQFVSMLAGVRQCTTEFPRHRV